MPHPPLERRWLPSRSSAASLARATSSSTSSICGVCHSDLHTVRGEWGGTSLPMVPGHEIVGRVSARRREVTKLKVGDMAGVGCMVDSCHDVRALREGLEQYCEKGRRLDVQQPRDATGTDADVRRLLDSHRRRRRLRPRRPADARSRRRGAAPLRRDHHLLAASSTGGSGRARRSASSGSAASATWR